MAHTAVPTLHPAVPLVEAMRAVVFDLRVGTDVRWESCAEIWVWLFVAAADIAVVQDGLSADAIIVAPVGLSAAASLFLVLIIAVALVTTTFILLLVAFVALSFSQDGNAGHNGLLHHCVLLLELLHGRFLLSDVSHHGCDLAVVFSLTLVMLALCYGVSVHAHPNYTCNLSGPAPDAGLSVPPVERLLQNPSRSYG